MTTTDYPLLERERELDEIERALTRGGAGAGLCLIIEGPAGVGKSSLLDAAHGFAQDAGYRVLSARAGEREREYSWGTVRNLFEPVLIASEPEELEQLWAGPAAAGRSLLEGGPAGDGADASSYGIFNGLYWLTRRLADRQPLLLAIDDLHWVDGPSLGFLEFLSRRVADLPVVLVGTLRPHEPGADSAAIAALAADPQAISVRPQPLSAEGSAGVLRARLGEAVTADVQRAGHDVTNGNPLLLSELARTIDVEGSGEAGTTVAGNIAALGARAVSRTVAVRLSRAGADSRRLAEAAAVLGEDAQLTRAIELAGLDDKAADAAALELVQLEVLRPSIKVQFIHPVVRAAIYDSIAAPDRVRLHRAAIEIMKRVSAPPTLIANHLLRIDPDNDPEAVGVLRQAAVMAAAGGDSRSASVLMRRALEEPPPEEQLTGILAQLGAAEMLIDATSAIEHLGAAFERIHEPPFKVAIAELLARSLVMQERVPEAVAVTEATLAAIPEDDEQLRRRTEVVLVETSLVNYFAVPTDVRERCRQLLADADTEGDDYGSRAMLSLQATADARTLSRDAEETAARGRIAAGDGILIREGINSITQLGPAQVLTLAGHYREAISLINKSLEWDERFGSMPGHLANMIFRGWAHLFSGDLASAAEDSGESLRLSRSYGLEPGVAWSAWIRAHALLLMGRDQQARALIAAEVPFEQETPWGWQWMNVALTRARIRLHDGDAEAALAEAGRARDMYEQAQGVASTWISWRPLYCSALLALDRSGEAAELAAEELELCRRWGAPRQIGIALLTLAAADEKRREPLLEEAVEVLEGSEARLALATALIDLGAEIRRRNRKSGSREPLMRGMTLAADCGAEPLAERAKTELRASGMRIRRTALSGPGSLTDSERRVADQAVAGKTNREIAGELFVTVKTVEVHLSNTYRKLGISGRRQLPQAMDAA